MAVLQQLTTPVDFGTDFDFLNDLNPTLALVSGTQNLGQAIAHRLQTPRGGLFYDPNYGFDCRGLLNETLSPGSIAVAKSGIRSECLKDERVVSCTVQLTQPDQKTLNITINGATAAGPFTLVLAVNNVSVSVLAITAP